MPSKFTGLFNDYIPNDKVIEIIEDINKADYIIAPIADNQMYDTLTAYGLKQITDEQCLNALSANNLGKQYVIKTQRAVDKLIMIERMYLCETEKEDYLQNKSIISNQGRNKASLSIEKYRRKGKYIDEFLRNVDSLSYSLASSQARIFENSVSFGIPSKIFIKCYMLSNQAKLLDDLSLDVAGLSEVEIFDAVKENIKTTRGELYPFEIMHYIGAHVN